MAKADDKSQKLIGGKLIVYTIDRSPIKVMLDADTAARAIRLVQACIRHRLGGEDRPTKKMGKQADIRCYEHIRQGMDFDEAAALMGISPDMAKAAYMRVLSGRYGSEVRV